jgi:hypothetical protein
MKTFLLATVLASCSFAVATGDATYLVPGVMGLLAFLDCLADSAWLQRRLEQHKREMRR